MNLQEFIDTLEHFPSDMPVIFHPNDWPEEFCSWRGDYSQITLARLGSLSPNTVSWWIKHALRSIGSTFFGYKGGEFVMSATTEIWADDYGCTHGNKLIGVRVQNEKLILVTGNGF